MYKLRINDKMKHYLLIGVICFAAIGNAVAESDVENEFEATTLKPATGAFKEGSRTDSETVAREEESINSDKWAVYDDSTLNEKAEKYMFQAEVERMMKLIINSLYKNKEIYLRELISNSADALDKIRLLSLTDKSQEANHKELGIHVKADKEKKILNIIDNGIGMTHEDLVKNLGTIAKSGTADFLAKMQDVAQGEDLTNMIGQFGVGFYSAFLVAHRVTVTTKHNDDKQYIWTSDATNFSIMEDPRGNTLKRGTIVSLHLKDEAQDFLEEDTIRNLILKYSQFVNFPIKLWSSKTVEEKVPLEEDESAKSEEDADMEKDKDKEEGDDAQVEDDAGDSDKTKTKTVSKTVWDWNVVNNDKAIWTRHPSKSTKDEYHEFYKSITKDPSEPLAYTHFVAEGEVTFKTLLYIPKVQPSESFNRYGTQSDNIKLYVRQVFITDQFKDILPNYLSFLRGIIDSDDLPLNVSRENLQQNKLIKVIKKKLVRKALEMMKKLDKEAYNEFWKEYSTNIKLGIIEDPSNRSRLSKLLLFQSSHGENVTSFEDYVSRMKPKQKEIYYIAGANRNEIEKSPFIERLLKKGYEVLYLVEAIDEHCISSLPEFDGKKFQNVAKDGMKLHETEQSKTKMEKLNAAYEPLLKWLKEVLADYITTAKLSERLTTSSCALVAGMFGWTGNMERLALSNPHQKANDPQRSYYLNQKKTLEINPRHPLIRELLRLVENDSADDAAKHMATMMVRTATLRSGFMLRETSDFADSVENMMRKTLGLSPDDEMLPEDDEDDEEPAEETTEDSMGAEEESSHDEL